MELYCKYLESPKCKIRNMNSTFDFHGGFQILHENTKIISAEHEDLAYCSSAVRTQSKAPSVYIDGWGGQNTWFLLLFFALYNWPTHSPYHHVTSTGSIEFKELFLLFFYLLWNTYFYLRQDKLKFFFFYGEGIIQEKFILDCLLCETVDKERKILCRMCLSSESQGAEWWWYYVQALGKSRNISRTEPGSLPLFTITASVIFCENPCNILAPHIFSIPPSSP